MRKTLYTGVVITTFLFNFASCSTPYFIYSQNIFVGKALFKQKEYEGAKKYFQEASKNQRDSISLTYLARVSYKMNDIENAERLIKEAEKVSGNNFYYLRTIGYKAIILLNKDKKAGLLALKDYLDYYKHQCPLMTIQEVEKMWMDGKIEIGNLETLMEEQISWYEDEIEQHLSTGTGFYDAIAGQ
jgi:tetratricopeptide (TPR) repeat protein